MAKDNIAELDSEGWETAVEESGSPIVFINYGDSFAGKFTGTQVITPEETGGKTDKPFNKHFFKDADGNVKYILGGYKLDEALAKISPQTVCRITFVGEVDMGPGKNPMKDYRLETKTA